MNSLIIIAAALLPAALLLLYIWKKDPQKEPTSQLLRGVFYGMLICIPVSIVELVIQLILFGGNEPTTLLGTTTMAFLVAAVPEECFKLLALWLLVRNNRYFDEHVDGIVYAVCVGLGFAALENVGYLFDNESEWVAVAATRALLAVPGHYAFAVIMGYYYSLYHFVERTPRNRRNILLMPILAHGIYDALAMSGMVSPIIGGISFLVLILFCIRMHRFAYKRLLLHLKNDEEKSVRYESVIEQWMRYTNFK